MLLFIERNFRKTTKLHFTGVFIFYFLLIKDIEEGVKFPSKPKVSKGCKELLRQIFVPVENRMTLDEVKANRWVQNFNAKE